MFVNKYLPYMQVTGLAGINFIPRVSHLPSPGGREDERSWERG